MIASVDAPLKAPFPWFGGKSRAAHLFWQGFGDCPNYVEPFFGSGASLFNRPNYDPLCHTETVNDLDSYLANFWRAVQADPAAVAHWADQPINEADLHARHRWLIEQDEFKTQIRLDPHYFDVKIAGWWVWGLCSWLGRGWCRSIWIQRPHLSAGRGVHRRRPHIGSEQGRADLIAYFEAIAVRLRRVRVCCGQWDRVLSSSITYKQGITGILLDPPYDAGFHLYSEANKVAADVREWAIANGDNPKLRIALCGYQEEHKMPEGWRCVGWAGPQNYQVTNRRFDERIWFSPHCLPVFSDFQIAEVIARMSSYGRKITKDQALAALRAEL